MSEPRPAAPQDPSDPAVAVGALLALFVGTVLGALAIPPAEDPEVPEE